MSQLLLVFHLFIQLLLKCQNELRDSSICVQWQCVTISFVFNWSLRKWPQFLLWFSPAHISAPALTNSNSNTQSATTLWTITQSQNMLWDDCKNNKWQMQCNSKIKRTKSKQSDKRVMDFVNTKTVRKWFQWTQTHQMTSSKSLIWLQFEDTKQCDVAQSHKNHTKITHNSHTSLTFFSQILNTAAAYSAPFYTRPHPHSHVLTRHWTEMMGRVMRQWIAENVPRMSVLIVAAQMQSPKKEGREWMQFKYKEDD